MSENVKSNNRIIQKSKVQISKSFENVKKIYAAFENPKKNVRIYISLREGGELENINVWS